MSFIMKWKDKQRGERRRKKLDRRKRKTSRSELGGKNENTKVTSAKEKSRKKEGEKHDFIIKKGEREGEKRKWIDTFS